MIERDGRCQRCGSTQRLTVDHRIPVSKGGTNEPDNLWTLCHACNSAKGNREDPRLLVARSDEELAHDSTLVAQYHAAKARLNEANAEYVTELVALVDAIGYAAVARELGVSRQAVRQLVERAKR